MDLKRFFAVLAASVTFFSMNLAAQPAGRQNYGDGWYFVHSKNYDDMFRAFKMGVSAVNYPPQVDIPHDWAVHEDFRQELDGSTGKLDWSGYARYYKILILKDEDLKGKKYYLDIDGAMANPKVYVKDSLAGKWAYGYSSFRTDLTPYLHQGGNIIVIELDNPDKSSRWYPGGGVYRNVWLVHTDAVGIAHWGTCVTASEISEGKAVLTIKTTLRNDTAETPSGNLTSTIKFGGRTVKAETTAVSAVSEGLEVTQKVEIDNPQIWSIEKPNLYTLETSLKAGNHEDSYTTTFGIRTAEFTKDGFFLNGRKTPLKGVCLHHDAGALGTAWNTAAWTRRLYMLKQMGCNAIRTSHNPPAPELLDLCDRMGFVVLDELTDTWTVPKTRNGYATIFDEWVEKDLVSLIRRDRNHPSVVLWSIGNEVGEQGIPEKYHIAYELSAICHRVDPTRMTTAGCDNLKASTQDWRNTIDVYGFNYKPRNYAKFREDNPDKPYYGSETASTISTRSWYVFPVSDNQAEGKDSFQVSSYDLYAPYWASWPDLEWEHEDKNPWVAGEFVWTGFDYLGEPTPYNFDMTILTNFHDEAAREKARKELEETGKIATPSRSSYFGIIDLAGFPKDRYWLYQARWRPEIPMAHILPHWNWAGREGEKTPVMVYTSGDSAELFINGKSQGRKEKGQYEYRLRWDDVVYEPGTVEVVAYKDGREWARDKVETTGEPAKLVMEAEAVPSLSGGTWNAGPGAEFGGDRLVRNAGRNMKYTLGTDPEGRDLVYVDVKVADSKGRLVPTASNDLEFSISGPGEIVATDAGDPTSHVRFTSTSLPAFGGLCSAIVRPIGAGTITLTVSGKGLQPSTIKIKVKQ